MLYPEERQEICDYVKMMFDRKFTNTAGGNVSVKVNDEHYLMTPSLMSQQYHCELSPEQILVIDNNEEIVEGEGTKTREINMHMAAYRENPNAHSVIHAHALDSMFFATVGLDMPNITEASHKLGELKCLDYRPATTPELAEIVKEQVRKDGGQVPKAYLLNKHGVLVLGESLQKNYDMLERLEWNANIAFKYMVFDKLGIDMDLTNLDSYEMHE